MIGSGRSDCEVLRIPGSQLLATVARLVGRAMRVHIKNVDGPGSLFFQNAAGITLGKKNGAGAIFFAGAAPADWSEGRTWPRPFRGWTF